MMYVRKCAYSPFFSLSLTLRHSFKTSTVKNLNKPKKPVKARSVVVIRANQRVVSIPHIQEYSELQDISTTHLVVGY